MRVGNRLEENAVWSYETPYDEGERYAGYLALYWKKMDQWFEDDAEIFNHPPDPFDRPQKTASRLIPTTAEKADAFQKLHQRNGAFIIPNPWDVGSARIMEGMGFEAMATTSSGLAMSLGLRDGEVSRAKTIEHCKEMCAATRVPFNADLEDCFAEDPELAASTIVAAADAGIVGGSIEDYTGDPANPIYDFDLSVERVAAAAEAVKTLNFPFMLTARAETLLRSDIGLDETIRRLQAYEAAGADILYAPALKSLDEIKQVRDAVTKPLNVLVTSLKGITKSELQDAGAKRISIGGGLARMVTSSLVGGLREMTDDEAFDWTADIIPGGYYSEIMAR